MGGGGATGKERAVRAAAQAAACTNMAWVITAINNDNPRHTRYNANPRQRSRTPKAEQEGQGGRNNQRWHQPPRSPCLTCTTSTLPNLVEVHVMLPPTGITPTRMPPLPAGHPTSCTQGRRHRRGCGCEWAGTWSVGRIAACKCSCCCSWGPQAASRGQGRCGHCRPHLLPPSAPPSSFPTHCGETPGGCLLQPHAQKVLRHDIVCHQEGYLHLR